MLDLFSGESVTIVSLWAVWLVTLIAAWLLARRPARAARALHRRLTYGKKS